MLKETVNEGPSSSKYFKLSPTRAKLNDIQNRRRKSNLRTGREAVAKKDREFIWPSQRLKRGNSHGSTC